MAVNEKRTKRLSMAAWEIRTFAASTTEGSEGRRREICTKADSAERCSDKPDPQ